jgi:hypothetical protein
VRVRWKAGAVLAFAAALALLVADGSPLAFVAGLSLQTLLAISLSLYFKTGIFRTGIFNLADVAITLGVLMVASQGWRTPAGDHPPR